MKPTAYKKRILNETPPKALTFLRTAAIKAEIRAALVAAGYLTGEQALEWELQTAEPPLPANPALQVRDEALPELRVWHEDRSETARALVRRRDSLVMLGLASRRVRQPDSDEPGDDPDAPADDPNASVAIPPAPPPGNRAAVEASVAAS